MDDNSDYTNRFKIELNQTLIKWDRIIHNSFLTILENLESEKIYLKFKLKCFLFDEILK